MLAIVFFIMCLCCLHGFAQTSRPLTWHQDLQYLQGLSPEEAAAHQSAIQRIRTDVENWIEAHPASNVQLEKTTTMDVSGQIKALSIAVAVIMKLDPAHPFHLGVTEIEVSTTVSPLSPVADSIDQSEIREHNVVSVTRAIEYLPGVEIQHLAGNRNEAAFMIRGFSSNGQVPLYLDSIPIYVPYDGYIDLNRFLTSDLSEIQVAKGYSSALLGPNALGGSVNLVTREPEGKLEGDLLLGTASGNALLAGLHVGSRWSQFFIQGTLDWSQADYVPLPGNFSYPTGGYNALTPGATGYVSGNMPYPLTNEENRSATRDEKWGGRFGWTPKRGDEYVFSYISQKGEKGVPLYQGSNANAVFRNFWEWPYWNKTSYYFLTNTRLGLKSSIRFRAFYDQFRNSINMYDNSSYSTMTKSSSQISRYNDHTDGVSAEFATHLLPRNSTGVSLFFKDDLHRENGIYAPTSSSPLVIPDKVLRDQQTSIALQDVIKVTSRLHVTFGFSADHLNGLQAETYNAVNKPRKGTPANTVLLPYQCANEKTNTSFAGCTAHYWNVNPQAAATYAVGSSDTVFVTFADRGRFPTLKQRYSSGMGSALPNPDLTAEKARTWNVGHSHIFGNKLTTHVELFRSDLRDAIEGALVADPGIPVTLVALTPAPTASLLCPNNTSHSAASYYNCSQNINIGKETHEGVEFEFRSRPSSRFTFDGNYTYLNRTVGNAVLPIGVSISSALVLPTGIPKHAVFGNATVRLPRDVMGFVSARYLGGITLQDTSYSGISPLYLPHGSAFATLDLGTTIPFRERFSAQVGLKNAFDRLYYFTAGYPEVGRNWFLNLRYRF